MNRTTHKPVQPKAASRKRESDTSSAQASADSTATAVVEKAEGRGSGDGHKRADVFPVVGVGASAGGLEAFTKLLKSLPPKPGMAFVLVPHLDPTHESAMTDLLARATKMPVLQVHDGMRPKKDHVYIIPPNHNMTIFQGVLRLADRRHAGVNMPIDTFLRSLASDLGTNAIGVILSGTATDGTQGVAAIKNEGGITFAQDSQSAKYDGMPNSAISSGCIDLVLPPEGIAEELVRIREHPHVAMPEQKQPEQAEAARSAYMAQVFRLLKQVSKVDFSDYKAATIRRRVMRRMALRRVDTLGDYLKLLQQDRAEVDSLYNDLLINVTNFFRDPEVFDTLRKTIYPEIMKGRAATDTVRLWVPGCSTGEEAYSHAIALIEYLTEHRAEVPVQIFATDLSESAIRKAREGVYRESITVDVPAARLKRFFNKVEGGYQIAKAVRDVCIFANQNVFADPPFSHIDIVSCRNVLIYLSQTLQKRVIPIFHYALRPGGFLIIGNTEGLVGTGAELFEPVHKKLKIYRKNSASRSMPVALPPVQYDGFVPPVEPAPTASTPELGVTPIEIQREADRVLLTRYAPASVVIGPDLEILQTRGQASRYLELASGKASLNLLKMIKPGLLSEVHNVIDEAKHKGTPARKEDLQVEVDGSFARVSVEAIPFLSSRHGDGSMLVVFEQGTGSRIRRADQEAVSEEEHEDAKDKLIAQLRQELTATKEYQQSVIEALEASNEELQSANEEIQSGNEELQSTNEELQTSKEELESANEELNTVNEEMQHRNYLLAQVNNDLINLLAGLNIGILMLGSDLSIRRFNPRAEELLGLGSMDVGRRLVHVKLRMNIPDFEQMMIEVMRNGTVRQREFEYGSTWYRVRLSPYRTDKDSIEGVVAVVFDMSELRVSLPQRAKRNKRG